jgi:isoquinoline 1-oxidoreductase subunit beta
MKRRTFLAAGSSLCVGFLSGCAKLPVIPKRPKAKSEGALSWIRYEKGNYTLSLPRVEMGQNIATAMKQIACEELGIPWSALAVQLHDTRSVKHVRATVGSESIKDFAVPLAQACATLRDALARGIEQGVLVVEDRPISELRAFAKDTRFVGRAAPIEHAAQIVRGQALYASDIRRDGMRYGRVLRAPVSPELSSRPLRWNHVAASQVPGFVTLVEDELLSQMGSVGLGIVAETPGALDRIAEALAVEWSVEGRFDQKTIDNSIDIDWRLQSGALSKRIANDGVARDSKWQVDLRIDVPLAAHAPIEPRVAVAEFEGADVLRLWVGSQDVFYQRDVVAKRLGLDIEKVVVYGMRVGGAFGGKTICTVELEAAVLARAAKRPIKAQWTRAQEFQYGFHRPPSSHRIRATVKDGRIDQWWHGFASSHILFTNAVLPPWMQRVTDLIGDDGVARGAKLAYRANKVLTEFDLVRLPVLTGPWRGLGAGPNHLAIESAIDECARVANQDPLQFRINNAMDSRLARAVVRVGALARWTNALPATHGAVRRGRGVACGIYKEMSYAAVVAQVAVDTRSGDVRLEALWCTHDCGRVINPDQVRAQCEGNLVWGIGMVFSDRLPVSNSSIGASTFLESPIPRFAQVPSMTIELIDEGEAPTGAGETVIVAAAAAITNAIREATGKRIVQFPLDPMLLKR